MVVAHPFSRAIYVYGEPMHVPRDGDVEEWRLRVEAALNELADQAENHFEELWKEGAG
jgi:lysophospholipid acyltransferase (LPLAT)-like uncharacterized protein